MSAMHEMAIRSGGANALNRSDVVRFRSTVVYHELPAGVIRRVTLVGPRESDASVGRVSVLSPIGKALLGRSKGHVVEVELPMGRTIAVRVADVMGPAPDEVDERTHG
jgi:transcription elongation GreA/GreB family factor